MCAMGKTGPCAGFTGTAGRSKITNMLALRANKLFSRIAEAEVARLQEVTREVAFPSGDIIFKEGDLGDAVYVIKTGTVQISAVVEAGERHALSKIGPGE